MTRQGSRSYVVSYILFVDNIMYYLLLGWVTFVLEQYRSSSLYMVLLVNMGRTSLCI